DRDPDGLRRGGPGRAGRRGGRLRLSRQAVPGARPARGDPDGAGAARGARGAAGGGRVARGGARGAEGDRAGEGDPDGEGGAERGGRVRPPAPGEPGLRAADAGDRGGGRRGVEPLSGGYTPRSGPLGARARWFT